MNVDLGIWSKLTKVVVGLVVLAVLLLIGNWNLPVIRENERMRSRILDFENQIQAAEARSKKLQAELDALQHDSNTQERLIRAKLRYAKPDETVIFFQSVPTNTVGR